MKLCVIISPT